MQLWIQRGSPRRCQCAPVIYFLTSFSALLASVCQSGWVKLKFTLHLFWFARLLVSHQSALSLGPLLLDWLGRMSKRPVRLSGKRRLTSCTPATHWPVPCFSGSSEENRPCIRRALAILLAALLIHISLLPFFVFCRLTIARSSLAQLLFSCERVHGHTIRLAARHIIMHSNFLSTRPTLSLQWSFLFHTLRTHSCRIAHFPVANWP